MIYQVGSEAVSVRLEPLANAGAGDVNSYRAFIGDREVLVRAQQVDGAWRLIIDGVQTLVYTAAQGQERFAALNGETYALTVAESRRRGAGTGSGDLTAQMPGQVRAVLVQPGDAVTRGQTLVLLEAMKMEIRVGAPADGQVKRVLVAVGDVVDRGQRLVELGEPEKQD